jgi:hypothetical protein
LKPLDPLLMMSYVLIVHRLFLLLILLAAYLIVEKWRIPNRFVDRLRRNG